jgi:hypothetical protein
LYITLYITLCITLYRKYITFYDDFLFSKNHICSRKLIHTFRLLSTTAFAKDVCWCLLDWCTTSDTRLILPSSMPQMNVAAFQLRSNQWPQSLSITIYYLSTGPFWRNNCMLLVSLSTIISILDWYIELMLNICLHLGVATNTTFMTIDKRDSHCIFLTMSQNAMRKSAPRAECIF